MQVPAGNGFATGPPLDADDGSDFGARGGGHGSLWMRPNKLLVVASCCLAAPATTGFLRTAFASMMVNGFAGA